MGTRSVVAAQFGDEIKGVYVHWDGYPEGVGKALVEIVARDGREKAVETLLGTPGGWSNIDATWVSDPDRDPTRFGKVEGYGVRYVGSQGDTNYRTPGDGGEAYFYLIGKDGTVAYSEGDYDPRRMKTIS